ncbi:hypothetical protein BJX64DRAFT_292924 [Aspergillus heterothallicus]
MRPPTPSLIDKIYRALTTFFVVRMLRGLLCQTLETKITRHLSNARKIRKLLSQILVSENAIQLLGLILHDSALVGHWETYCVVAPIVFERVGRGAQEQQAGYKALVTEALSLSISGSASALVIARDLVRRVLLISDEGVRAELLGWTLVCAAQEGNRELVEGILGLGLGLGRGVRHRDVHVAGVCSAARNHVDTTTLLINDIMNDANARMRGVEGPSSTSQGKPTSLQSYQCTAIAAAMTKALNNDAYETTALLLPVFITCMENLDTATQKTYNRNRVLSRIPLEGLEPLSRQGNADEPPDTTLRAGKITTRVHRDMLIYWSSYFAERVDESGANGIIDLSGHVTGRALGLVVKFMYSGVVPPRSASCWAGEDAEEVMGRRREVVEAGKFLRIQSLVELIEE